MAKNNGKRSPATLVIATVQGKIEIRCYVQRDGLAVTQSMRPWPSWRNLKGRYTITHVKSGLSVATVQHRATATWLLTKLLALRVDWTRSAKAIRAATSPQLRAAVTRLEVAAATRDGLTT
jgi:hypothetical protein